MRWCVACIVIELSQTALASLSCNLANSLDLAPVLLVYSRVLGLDRADLDLFLLPTQAVGLESCGSSVWAHCRFLRPRSDDERVACLSRTVGGDAADLGC